MNDDRAQGAAARDLFKLVVPAAVVGHGLAAKVAFAGFEIRVVGVSRTQA